MLTDEIVSRLRDKAEVEGEGTLSWLLNTAADRLELYDGYTKALRFLTGLENGEEQKDDQLHDQQ